MSRTSILIAFVLIAIIAIAAYTATSLGKDGSGSALAICTMIGGVAVILARKIDSNDAKTEEVHKEVNTVKQMVNGALTGQIGLTATANQKTADASGLESDQKLADASQKLYEDHKAGV
jgi:predicted amino acid dehydrogenase